MCYGPAPGVKYNNYHAKVIGDLYEFGDLVQEQGTKYIFDKDRQEIKSSIGYPYIKNEPIAIESNLIMKNISSIRIIKTPFPFSEQIASLNVMETNTYQAHGILLEPLQDDDLFTFNEYSYFDCTIEILEECTSDY